MPNRLTLGLAAACLPASITPAFAQTDDAARIAQLEQRIAEQDARIAQLERLVLASPEVAGAIAPDTTDEPAYPAARSSAETMQAAAVTLSGDLRLRQEFNWSDSDARDRSRSVMRARLKAVYRPTRALELGARIVTGNEDDPNTADVTIGDFADDLTVGLDQAYVTAHLGRAAISGGKFALPFDRTDLVWDGDFNPYGVGANIALPLAGDRTHLTLAALYSIVAEDAAARGSDMLGGQVGISVDGGSLWSGSLVAGYFDYRLNALTGADAGDFRSNLRSLDGQYLSDFDIADVIARVAFHGLGADWPVTLTGEAVRNLGADDGVDDARLVELALGQAAKAHGTKLSYGYLEAEADAVFAAFSHDNIGLSTNYRLHQAALEHRLSPELALSLLWYHYQPLDDAHADPGAAGDWVDRMRINAVFAF